MATIYSIAEHCGVSPSTVSRAFSRPDLVRAEVRSKILATAQELGYQPNRNARGLARGTTGAIGLTVPDITNPFFPPLVRAVENLAWHQSQSVLLVDTGEDIDRERQALLRLREQVDGIVMVSPRAASNVLRDALAGTRGVLINRASRLLPHVIVDDAPAIDVALGRLAELGHEHVAYLGGPADSWMNSRRRSLLHATAPKHGLEIHDTGSYPATPEGGRAAVGALLDSRATAAVAFDDVMASGVLVELAARGVSVPSELSVLGCDDVILSSMLNPALSSIASAPAKLAAAALAALVDTELAVGLTAIPSSFVERTSTGPRP